MFYTKSIHNVLAQLSLLIHMRLAFKVPGLDVKGNYHLVYTQLVYYPFRLIAQPRFSGLGIGLGSRIRVRV